MNIDQIVSDLKFSMVIRISSFLIAIFMMFISFLLVLNGRENMGVAGFCSSIIGFTIINYWLSNRVEYLQPFINNLEKELE